MVSTSLGGGSGGFTHRCWQLWLRGEQLHAGFCSRSIIYGPRAQGGGSSHRDPVLGINSRPVPHTCKALAAPGVGHREPRSAGHRGGHAPKVPSLGAAVSSPVTLPCGGLWTSALWVEEGLLPDPGSRLLFPVPVSRPSERRQLGGASHRGCSCWVPERACLVTCSPQVAGPGREGSCCPGGPRPAA